MHTLRNEHRAEKWEYEDVSDDESMMGMNNYIAMNVGPGTAASPRQGLPLHAVPLTPQPVNTSILVPSAPKNYDFTNEDTWKNIQAPMQNTILDTLLEMF